MKILLRIRVQVALLLVGEHSVTRAVPPAPVLLNAWYCSTQRGRDPGIDGFLAPLSLLSRLLLGHGSLHLSVTPVPWDLIPTSGLLGHQAHTWCTCILVGKHAYA